MTMGKEGTRGGGGEQEERCLVEFVVHKKSPPENQRNKCASWALAVPLFEITLSRVQLFPGSTSYPQVDVSSKH